MFAIRIVQAILGNPQIFENSSANDGLVNNSGHIAGLYTAIKDSLRIDRNRRTMFALIQATGLVGADCRSQTTAFELGLECTAKRFAPIRVAATPSMAGGPLVATNEYVADKGWHQSGF